ncbi:hypothetical protein M408DRAFT_333431 [Serendipita vermifera MAFF 305830]|uniref:Uncharacterized protein n=1 Tax=Serendipita vermifera MAFF 305830 TaxID=933852 RepID=A0A0C2W4Q9_SERVB|nr:hypothetical protein M408DRAFT_333431 [Serendipita vermifera MAFF 305830]
MPWVNLSYAIYNRFSQKLCHRRSLVGIVGWYPFFMDPGFVGSQREPYAGNEAARMMSKEYQ